VISIGCQAGTRNLDLVDRLENPLTPLICELDFPDLLSGIDYKGIRNTNLHLIFH
jgi:hypothetical protein